MPTMATRLPGPHSQWLSGENIVMPAQSRGAAVSSGRASGMRSTKSSSTTICVL